MTVENILQSDPTQWFPMPVVLVSCKGIEESPNIIVIGCAGFSSWNPPILYLGIQSDRYSKKLIMESREFVVNVPEPSYVLHSDYCGFVSGMNVDEFQSSGLTPLPSTKVAATLIKECPLNIECKLIQVIPLGSHEMFIGEVVATHMDTEYVSGDKQFVPLILLSQNYVSPIDHVRPSALAEAILPHSDRRFSKYELMA